MSAKLFVVLGASMAALHCGPRRDPSAVSPAEKAFYAQHARVENCKSDVRASLGSYCSDVRRKELIARRDGGERAAAHLTAETKRLESSCEAVTVVRDQLAELQACTATFRDAVAAEASTRKAELDGDRHTISLKLAAVFRRHGIDFGDAELLGLWTR